MREHKMDQIAESLKTLTPDYNRPLVGDLDDVIFELENTIRDVEEVIAAGSDGAERVKKALFGLRIKLQSVLPMLFDDVIEGIDELIGPDE